ELPPRAAGERSAVGQEPGPRALQLGIVSRDAQQPQGHVDQDRGEDVAVRLHVQPPASVRILVPTQEFDETLARRRVCGPSEQLEAGDVDRHEEQRTSVVALPRATLVLGGGEHLQPPLDRGGEGPAPGSGHAVRPSGRPRAHSVYSASSARSSVTLSRVRTMIRITVSRSIFTGVGSKTAGLCASIASVRSANSRGQRQNSRSPGSERGRSSEYSKATSHSFRATATRSSRSATAASRFSGATRVPGDRPCFSMYVRGSQQKPRSRSSRTSFRILVSWSARPNAGARGTRPGRSGRTESNPSTKSPVSITPTVPAT